MRGGNVEKFSDCWTYPKQKIDELLAKKFSTNEILGIENGGTGADDVDGVIENLGLENTLQYKKQLGSNDDLNNFTTADYMGIYELGLNVTNAPAQWATLISIFDKQSNNVWQMVYNTTGIWVRGYTGSEEKTWSSWLRYGYAGLTDIVWTSTLTDFDETSSGSARLVFTAGLISNTFYFSIDVSWIRLQFKVSSGGVVQIRTKYGSSNPSDWKTISTTN